MALLAANVDANARTSSWVRPLHERAMGGGALGYDERGASMASEHRRCTHVHTASDSTSTLGACDAVVMPTHQQSPRGVLDRPTTATAWWVY